MLSNASCGAQKQPMPNTTVESSLEAPEVMRGAARKTGRPTGRSALEHATCSRQALCIASTPRWGDSRSDVAERRVGDRIRGSRFGRDGLAKRNAARELRPYTDNSPEARHAARLHSWVATAFVWAPHSTHVLRYPLAHLRPGHGPCWGPGASRAGRRRGRADVSVDHRWLRRHGRRGPRAGVLR